jgi:N,N-dimethylformamidase
MTPSRPEYQSRETLDALSAYVARGGRLMYLGGNGFYWKVALHRDVPGAVEIRRGEGGIRAWAAEPGEYYHAFDGAYGGLWRRNGRPPQQLVGVGFTSQAPFEGNWYRRAPGAVDPRAAWILEGVQGDVIGNFGLSGGGAAGFELDRADHRLGTPPNAIVAAERHRRRVVGGPRSLALQAGPRGLADGRADVDGGAAREADPRRHDVLRGAERRRGVLGGSITFCGSLPHDDFKNDISRIVDNVLRRFRDT